MKIIGFKEELKKKNRVPVILQTNIILAFGLAYCTHTTMKTVSIGSYVLLNRLTRSNVDLISIPT